MAQRRKRGPGRGERHGERVPGGSRRRERPARERALDPDAFKRAIQHGWGPRSFGVTQEQWRTHWTKDLLERWHWRYTCQRQGHAHDEAGTLDCMEESYANQPKRKPGRPKDPLKDVFARWQEILCYPDQHTHGDEGLLDCVMLQMLMREIELPPEVTAPAAQAPLASAARDQALSFNAAGKPMGPNAAPGSRGIEEAANANSRGTSRRSATPRAKVPHGCPGWSFERLELEIVVQGALISLGPGRDRCSAVRVVPRGGWLEIPSTHPPVFARR